ncbi:MAG: type VI secretion system-associated FHA domain protein [Minicystis sp.]
MPVALVARVIDTQANQQFDVTFERFPVRIGRNQLNDLHIDRPYVSQFHAAIDIRDKQIFVRDLGSTNGTVYLGRRLARDQPIDVTAQPELNIGPIVLRMAIVDQAAKKPVAAKEGNVLDINEGGAAAAAQMARPKPIPPGAEDPFIRQLLPYIEAYRTAWGAVYRVIYDHLTRLPAELRTNYLKRIGLEHPAVNLETDFQKIAQYYGVDPRTLGELGPPQAALAALTELARTLVPGSKPPEDVPGILTFARRLRDTTEVFFKSFISLRDGLQEFEAEVLVRDRESSVGGDPVKMAKDAKELGNVLLSPAGGPDAPRQLYDIFVEVMSHQVAMLDGVMAGVKDLLVQLSPRSIEDQMVRGGRKTGIFTNKYEALWKFYEDRHGDYSGEDKQTFLIIFGPQFARGYDKAASEDKGPGDAAGKNPRLTTANPVKR